MKKQKVKLIVNLNADLGRAWHKAGDLRPLIEELADADWEGTAHPSHAIELARKAAEDGYELVVAAGGDGTSHEVLNGLMQLPPDKRPKLGVIPLGSGNDFAYAIGMDPRPEIATRQVFTGTPKYIDVGRLQDNRGIVEYWGNAVGVGFDATVTIHSRQFTNFKGFMIYLLAVLKTIILNHDAPVLNVTMDADKFEEAMLLFVLCNGSREGGGFMVAPDAKPDDGIFHYTGIKRVSRLMMLRLVPEVMKGTHGKFRETIMGQFHTMELQADRPLVMHMDGEIFAGFGTDVRKFSVEIIPNAIQAIT